MNIKNIQNQINVTADGIWGEQSKQALRAALNAGKVIKITDNISLNELIISPTAKRYGIDNIPNQAVLQNLIDSSVNLWQPAREILGQAMHITSGYRSPQLNSKVGGAANSAHKFGYAIDFHCPKFGNTRQIVQFLAKELPKKGIKFDQAIIEYPKSPNSWVHLGYKHPSGKQRGQVFVIG
ncbi:YcbK family protein [Moraxella sp. ZJ142]|uniref:YcbK family protein n=1 Tax=Moraxella marmotae TaxID=3344520 RepID=UPI0035D4F340